MIDRRPELLAPAGDWDCLRAAVANGADAVYFGLPRFNARLRAHNFTEVELPEVMRFLHARGVRGLVTMNTLIFTDELPDAADQLRHLEQSGVDAVIVQDLGLVRLAGDLAPGLAVHASTQMTITSPEGARFAAELGARRVVLARELSLRELAKFQTDDIPPLEVFVHGALCVAYSGQCLTSEALGQRSANRGECAQACRMPYELVVDGEPRDLGDRRYLLSPQDLAAVDQIADLVRLGVCSFKIEGRLKSPEYVAAVTQVYRRAIDAALASQEHRTTPEERYQLEMTFSRGLFTGWLHGVNHQQLVSARFGKKRGPLLGRITRVGADHVEIAGEIPVAPGDGVVFDTGGDTENEQGGRIYEVRGRRLFFKHRHIDFKKLHPGDRVWKTDDPALNHRLRRSFAGGIPSRKPPAPLLLRVTGSAGRPLVLEATVPGRAAVRVESTALLQDARTQPLREDRLHQHLGRFGTAPYVLETLDDALEGDLILPISALNQTRRDLITRLDAPAPTPAHSTLSLTDILETLPAAEPARGPASLAVLCRTMEQLEAATAAGAGTLYADFEDIRRYKDAVSAVRGRSRILLATPRIQKAGEQGFFKLIENAAPDGVLIRNLGAIERFRDSNLVLIGDFSLNVANPLTADLLIRRGLCRVTVSYDLNIEQVLSMVAGAPPEWFELTLHQHMPMFHMEHCVFAAFLSEGTDHTNCGRPCDRHRVHLRDRVGMEHPLRADVGCRNTLFNAVPQSGAPFLPALIEAGLRHFRIELLEESASETTRTIATYKALLEGGPGSTRLWQALEARSQLGVTRGTFLEA